MDQNHKSQSDTLSQYTKDEDVGLDINVDGTCIDDIDTVKVTEADMDNEDVGLDINVDGTCIDNIDTVKVTEADMDIEDVGLDINVDGTCIDNIDTVKVTEANMNNEDVGLDINVDGTCIDNIDTVKVTEADMDNVSRIQDIADSNGLQQTMIIHDVKDQKGTDSNSTAIKVDGQNEVELNVKSSKELASDEVLGGSNIVVGDISSKDRNSPVKSGETSKLDQQIDFVKSKFPQNKPDTIKQKKYVFHNGKMYSKLLDDALNSQAKIAKDQNKKKLDNETLGLDNDSFSILDDLEEYGAVGGYNPSTNSTHADILNPSKDNISGILHRKTSVSKKSSSVQFDDSVVVETFLQTEPASDFSPQVVKAQGDGPDPNQASAGMVGPFTANGFVTRLNDLSDATNDNAENERSLQNHASSPQSSHRETSTKKIVQRQNSAQKVKSPTELLRLKQKNVTDKIMKFNSMSANNSSPEKIPPKFKDKVRPRTPSDENDHKQDISKEMDGRQASFKQNDSENSALPVKQKIDDDKRIKSVSENQVGLIRVNSSDFVDPRFITNLPDCHFNKIQKIEDKTKEEMNNMESISSTSPSKLIQKIEDREKTEQNNQDVGSFDYATQSVLFERYNETERSHNSNDKRMHQANKEDTQLPDQEESKAVVNDYYPDSLSKWYLYDNHDGNSDSYRSEQQHKQVVKKKITEGKPGYWFFKSSDSSCSESLDSQKNVKSFSQLSDANKRNPCDDREASTEEMLDELSKDDKIMERLRKKKKIDELRISATEEMLDGLSKDDEILDRFKTKKEIDELRNSTTEEMLDEQSENDEILDRFKSNRKLDELRNLKLEHINILYKISSEIDNVQQQKKSQEMPEDAIPTTDYQENRILLSKNGEDHSLHSHHAQEAVDYMNSLLTDFLHMIRSKNEQGIPISVDDHMELDLIQTTILYIGKRLTSLEESADSGAMSQECLQAPHQEGNSSHIYVDSHDRDMIEKYMDRVKISLSITEKHMQSWSNSMMDNLISKDKHHRKDVHDSNSDSVRTYTRQNEDQSEKESEQNLNGIKTKKKLDELRNSTTEEMLDEQSENDEIPYRFKSNRKLDELRNLKLEHINILNKISSEIDNVQQQKESQEMSEDTIPTTDYQENRILLSKNGEDHSLHSHHAQEAVDYMNSLLTDFLHMIRSKNEQGIPITVDDHMELDLIQTTILYIGKRLTSLEESADSGAMSQECLQAPHQEGNSSHIYVDSHDRDMIEKYMDRVKISLSNTEKHMQSWSNSMMDNLISKDKHHRKDVHGSNSDSVRTYTRQNEDQSEKEREQNLNGIFWRTEMDGNLQAFEESQNYKAIYRKDSLAEGYLADNESKESIHRTLPDYGDSFVSTCEENSCSGYLGDRSASENSMPDIRVKRYARQQDSKTQYSINDKRSEDTQGTEQNTGKSDIQLPDIPSYNSFAGISPTVSLGNYMSESSLSPNRESDWSLYTDGRQPTNTSHRQGDPGIQWSRISTGNKVMADYMYPGYFMVENNPYNRSLSTVPQTHSQNDIGQRNLQFTSNPNFKPQSSSEFEHEEGEICNIQSNERERMPADHHCDIINSPRKIKLLSCISVPDDLRGIHMELGSTSLTVGRQEHIDCDPNSQYGQEVNGECFIQEGSPERGQRLHGSSQNLEWRSDAGVAKRKQPGARSITPDSRSFMMEREVNDSQNRKLQMEISTLQTENKLLKEKQNRSQDRISELENQLADAQEDLNTLQDNLNEEVSNLSLRTKQEIERGRDEMQSKIMVLTKENQALKAEVSSIEKRLQTSQRVTDMARHNSEKTRTIDAYKLELSTMKEELNRVKALLDQSEKHLRDEEDRHTDMSKQVLKLTELKNALQQQSDSGGSGAIADKQIKSLETRLKVTEERLHHERSDRANNLSAVEDKLLTDNSRLQAAEKDLKRQLQREKEKNRNLDHRVKQLREENEKLRIALPFDDALLTSDKGKYDIPYSSHSSQRAETMKNISDDMNYILSQIEKQDGLSSGQEEEIICTLWNKRELAYKHLREYELQIEELQIHDNNNIVDGLKNLRDTYSQSESKLRTMEEKVEDVQALMSTAEVTYKEQLSGLVRERHDAFAKLKTAEDLLEAVRAENESLRKNVTLTHGGVSGHSHLQSDEVLEALKQENVSLEGKVAQLKRTNEKLDGELTTAKVQFNSRNKALQDVQSELDLAYNRLQGEEVDDRKQIKIDTLTAQVSNYQIELKSWQDKYNVLVTEKSRLETELSLLKKSTSPPKGRQQKMEQIDSKVLQQLKDDFIDKESRLVTVNKQLLDTDNELQKIRQELYIEQMHSSELEDELDTVHHTANQRAQMFEALSGSEREQLAQYQILKDTLDSVNQELAQKQAQIISLDVNLSGQRDKTVELEHEVETLRRERKDNEDIYTEEEQNSAHQLRIKVLEDERSQLKQELTQAYSAIQAAEEQYRTLQTESSQLEQELVKEKTIILQITAEKGEVEQHLEELAEEHDALIQEKNQVEEDLIKLETKLQQILLKYETEAKKQHSDFTKKYPTLPPEGRKLVSELDSLRLVVEGKNRELEMLNDKLSRSNIEIDFLNRKVELVHNDSISNREDVARMISELTLKMKEAVSTREVNQYLVEERTKLHNEKSHLERELERERKTNDERKTQIVDVIRKIERTETHKKSAEKDSKAKEGTIASLEIELGNCKHSLGVMESENFQLKNKLDHLSHDLNNLKIMNDSLNQRLNTEQGNLSEEKETRAKLKEDHLGLSHDYHALKQNHKELSDKYEVELRNVEILRKNLDEVSRENSELTEECHAAQLELESHKGQLTITKESVQQLQQDKGSIYQDYESMCRTLTEKERQLNEQKNRSEEKLELVNREHAQEKLRLEEHKNTAVMECESAKKEMNSLNEQLKQKEIQLSTFGKTLQELETVSREKQALESHVYGLESTTGDSKLLLEGQRKEIMALNESLAKQQQTTIQVESANNSLQSELKSEKDNSSREIHELNIMVKELKSQHDNERHYLNDNLSQTQTRLRSVETSLASAFKERDQLQGQQRIKEKALEDLQAKFADESTGRRLAEQSVGSLRLQLEDAKNAKNVAEARLTEMQTQLNKAENQHKTELGKTQKLFGKVQELQAVTHTTESSVKAKSEQLDTLQKEISKLKQLLDSQKQSHIGKMKKSTLEFKQQLDLVQEEKDKLVLQVQQIAADLDSCREQVANKNKENLKLQEDMLMMEDSLRESKIRQKQAEETLKIETEKQSDLSSRFRDQDDELKRLRNFLAKKVEDSGDADKSMWHEMNRVIQELSKQMHNHLDAQRSGGTKEGEGQSVVRYKKQITELQSDLNTEKSLHQITKTSLQALEEDCQRLRQQLQTWRRRDPHTSEKKYKNRMEAINAIIARSQTQAQALLASGGYLGNSMTSPRMPQHHRTGYGSPQHQDSPDNSFSEDLSIASLPPMHYGSPTKYP